MDVMAALKERRAKAEGKVARAEKALDSAKKELDDVLAAERVMADITGESLDARPTETPASERDIRIAKLLPPDKADAISPADLLPKYIQETGDSIQIEAFRTAVWRLLKKKVPGVEKKAWEIKSDSGKYWREPVADEGTKSDFDEIFGGEDEDPFA